MRSFFPKAALAAAILTLAGAGAASAGEFSIDYRDGGCAHYCRTHWGGYGPPVVVERRSTIDLLPVPVVTHPAYWAAPVPVTPVYVDASQNPHLGSILGQVTADDRLLDADRAAGRISAADYWRLRGEAQAIRDEARSLDGRGYVPSGRLAALQGEASHLTRAVDRIG